MKTPLEALQEIENFLSFQLQHTERHMLKKYVVTADKTKELLRVIREAKQNSSSAVPSNQDSYNAWFTQEIEALKVQVAELEQKIKS